MRKLTFLIIATFITIMGFAQVNTNVANAIFNEGFKKDRHADWTFGSNHNKNLNNQRENDDCPPETLPYSENFNSGVMSCYTVFDENNDGYPWDLQQLGNDYMPVVFSYGGANDYMITNGLNFEEAGDYIVSFDYAGTVFAIQYGMTENLKVILATEPTLQAMNTGTVIADYQGITNSELENSLDTVTIETPGVYYIGFYCYSTAGYYIIVDNISVIKVPTAPEIALTDVTPTNGTTVQTAGFNLSTTITNNGIPLTSYTVSYTIDDEPTVTETIENVNVELLGTDTYTSETITLTQGEHTIVVTVSNPNGIADNTADNSTTITINAIDCEPATVPYTENFNNGLSTCYTIINANNDDKTWGVTDGSAVYTYSYYNNADDYMITNGIYFEEGIYVLSFDTKSGMSVYPENLEVFVGNAPTVTAMTTSIVDVPHIANTSWANISGSFYIETAGVYYIGFKAYSDANMLDLYIDNIHIETAPTNIEIALTSVTPVNGISLQVNTDINLGGVLTNNGGPLTSFTASYTINGGEAVSQTFTLDPAVTYAQTYAFTFDDVIFTETGEYEIVVTISEPNGVADGTETNNSLTTTINIVDCDEPITTFPYTEDFDNGINPCWTIIDADSDGYNWVDMANLYGAGRGHNGSTSCLVSESYVNSTSSALNPDNWAITPAFSLPADSPALLSFYAAIQDVNVPSEHYGVYVSTTTTDPDNFTLLFEETMDANGGLRAQSPWVEKHVNLSAYAGQTIYIAFRHFNCTDMFSVLIDDLTVALENNWTTEIDENIASSIAVYPNPTNNIVTIANAEGQNITIVNSLGQVVANIENASANQTIDVSNFANGTYFVKVNAEVVKLNVVK